MIVAAFAVVATACGGDDDTVAASDSPFVAAIAGAIMDDSDPDSPITSQEDAECWAGRIVGAVGEDRLVELGVTVDNPGEMKDYDFDEDEFRAMIGSLEDCVDLRQFMADQLVEDFGQEGADCVADELSGDLLTDLMVAGMRDLDTPEAFFQEFLDIAADCDLPLN